MCDLGPRGPQDIPVLWLQSVVIGPWVLLPANGWPGVQGGVTRVGNVAILTGLGQVNS